MNTLIQSDGNRQVKLNVYDMGIRIREEKYRDERRTARPKARLS